jgi:hypothetical protein
VSTVIQWGMRRIAFGLSILVIFVAGKSPKLIIGGVETRSKISHSASAVYIPIFYKPIEDHHRPLGFCFIASAFAHSDFGWFPLNSKWNRVQFDEISLPCRIEDRKGRERLDDFKANSYFGDPSGSFSIVFTGQNEVADTRIISELRNPYSGGIVRSY